MSPYRTSLVGLIVSLSLVGCGGGGSSPSDAPVDSLPPCTSNASCTDPTGVCNLDSGKCVACTETDHTACTGITPICGSDNTCQKCSMHSQCASNVCLPDGSCDAGDDVAYVDQSIGGGFKCTKAEPCSLLSVALTTNQPYIKITGSITDNVTVTNKVVVILADANAQLTEGAGIPIKVDGTAQVTIYDLEVGGTPTNGISMQPGNTAALSLYRVKITGSTGSGIVASGNGTLNIVQSTINSNSGGISYSGNGTVNAIRSTISNNSGSGIIYSGDGTLNLVQSTIDSNSGKGVLISGDSTLNITRSEIGNNSGGGIIMNSATKFDIANNFIIANGNDGPSNPSDVGGVLAKPDGISKIEFNTIVGNRSASGVTRAGGILCDEGGFDVPYNLIFSNIGGAGQTLGNCDFSKSLTAAPNGDAKFKSATDFHLTANTPSGAGAIRDAVDCSGITDFDGEIRPKNGICDLGADEF